jgi:hypothetical protein
MLVIVLMEGGRRLELERNFEGGLKWEDGKITMFELYGRTVKSSGSQI